MPGDDGISICFLATLSAPAQPRLAPVCPIFFDHGVYLSIGARTPKRRDLAARGRYVLHAFLGANDEAFQLAGRAREVADAEERNGVVAAIPFGAHDAEDPIFELLIERALWVTWENVGRPGSRPIKQALDGEHARVASRCCTRGPGVDHGHATFGYTPSP